MSEEKPKTDIGSIDAAMESMDSEMASRKRNSRKRIVGGENFSTREVELANLAWREGKKPSIAHYDAPLRMGLSVVTFALIMLVGLASVLSVLLVLEHNKNSDRPIYYRDPEGVTHRLLQLSKDRQKTSMRDQLDEYCHHILTSLYTYTPQGQPRIDLLTNQISPEIIDKFKLNFQKNYRVLLGLANFVP
jgi:hypothetical protein